MPEMLPLLDIPQDLAVGRDLDYALLKYYMRFPCKIRAAVFFMCTGGSLTATINFSEYTLGPGDFVFCVPDSYIQMYSLSEDFSFCFAAFSSGFLAKANMTGTAFEFVPAISRNPVIKLSEEQYGVFSEFFDLMINATQCPGLLCSTETRKTVLNMIMQQVGHLYPARHPSGGKGREREIYMQFIQLLHQHYYSEHRINFYAERIGVTVQHFCNTVKKTTGRRATEIIDKFLFMEAKTRLRFTDMPVKNIALELGFTNSNFFYRWFRQRAGQTPVEYRNGMDEIEPESDIL